MRDPGTYEQTSLSHNEDDNGRDVDKGIRHNSRHNAYNAIYPHCPYLLPLQLFRSDVDKDGLISYEEFIPVCFQVREGGWRGAGGGPGTGEGLWRIL